MRQSIKEYSIYEKRITTLDLVFKQSKERRDNNEVPPDRIKISLDKVRTNKLYKTILHYTFGKPLIEVRNEFKNVIAYTNENWVGLWTLKLSADKILNQYILSAYDEMLWMLSLGYLLDIPNEDFKKIVEVIDQDGVKDYLFEFIISAKLKDREPITEESYQDGLFVDELKGFVKSVIDRAKNDAKLISKSYAINKGHELTKYIIWGMVLHSHQLNEIEVRKVQQQYADFMRRNRNKNITDIEFNKEIVDFITIDYRMKEAMKITEAATKTTLTAQENIDLAFATDHLINNTNDPKLVALGLLLEYKYGVGADKRTFASNHSFTSNMKNAPGVQEALDLFYSTRISEYNNGGNPRRCMGTEAECRDEKGKAARFSVDFNPLTGPIQAGADWIEQYVGSYYVSIYPPTISDATQNALTIQINNPTHLNSLLFHVFSITGYEELAEYLRVPNQITPLGLIEQEAKWKVQITNTNYQTILNTTKQ